MHGGQVALAAVLEVQRLKDENARLKTQLEAEARGRQDAEARQRRLPEQRQVEARPGPASEGALTAEELAALLEQLEAGDVYAAVGALDAARREWSLPDAFLPQLLQHADFIGTLRR